MSYSVSVCVVNRIILLVRKLSLRSLIYRPDVCDVVIQKTGELAQILLTSFFPESSLWAVYVSFKQLNELNFDWNFYPSKSERNTVVVFFHLPKYHRIMTLHLLFDRKILQILLSLASFLHWAPCLLLQIRQKLQFKSVFVHLCMSECDFTKKFLNILIYQLYACLSFKVIIQQKLH